MKYTKLLITTAILIILGACGKEYLEDTETLTFKPSGISTTDDYEKLLAGAYFIFSNNTGDGGLHENPMVVNNMMSDNVAYLSDNDYRSEDNRLIYNRETSENETDLLENIWESAYKTANQASLPITKIEINGRPTDEKADQIDRILGEAHFLRAYAHFVLIKMFAPPYDASNIDLPGIILKRMNAQGGIPDDLSTVGETYEFILEDIDKAIAYLPESYLEGIHPPEYETGGRVKRDAARFLKARVLFQMGENAEVNGQKAWTLAKNLIDTIIDNPAGLDKRTYTLEEPQSVWLSLEANPTPSEVVWEYINTQWKNSKRVQFFMANNSVLFGANPQKREFPVSQDLIDQAEWTSRFSPDKRFQQLYVYVSPANDFTEGTYFQNLSQPYLWANMFAGYAGKGYKVSDGKRVELSGAESNINTPLMRIAELHLLRATIVAKEGENPKEDMDAILLRTGLNNKIKSVYSLDDVINEHRKEFAFEGKRVDYLKALRMTIPGGDNHYDKDGLTDISRPDEEWNSPRLYWAIPQVELIRNPNL